MIVYLFVLLSYVMAVSCMCDNDAFRSCECGRVLYLGKEQYILNCTNQGFTNVDNLASLPDETEVLIFTGNDIRELPWNLFGTKNHTKLRVIDMSSNNIKVIHGKSFHRVSTVERLILNHNEISISSTIVGQVNAHHPRMFSNFEGLLELHLTNAFMDSAEGLAEDLHEIFINSQLKKLRKIHLEQNEITRFKHPEIFCDLPSLMDIYLANNRIDSIDFEMACLPNLRFIDLEHNAISVVTPSDMEKMDAVTRKGRNLTVDIGENPLACGDQLTAFYSWLECSKVSIRNKGKLKCVDHTVNKSCSIVVVPSSCQNVKTMIAQTLRHLPEVPNTSLHSLSLLMVVTLFLSISLNLFFVYAKQFPHDPVGNWFRRWSRTFTTSVHYTKQGNLDDI